MLAAVLLTAGCGGTGGGLARQDASVTPTPRASASASPAPTATAPAAPFPGLSGPPSLPAAIRRRAARLPVDQQVGQLFVVGFRGTDLRSDVFDQLRGHGWGGIVIGPDNASDPSGFPLFAGEARVVARDAKRIPPLVAAINDGRPPRVGATRSEARSRARTASDALSGLGITLTTAPFIDVGLEADSNLVARVAPAAVKGWLAGGVAPAPGHFPGQGATTQDPLDGPANVGLPKDQLTRRDLKPFRTALRFAPAVTVSSAAFTGYDSVTPAALTPAIVRGLLRRDLRFSGAAMTDDLATLTAATGDTPERAAVDAIATGMDIVYVPDATQRDAVYTSVLRAVRAGRLPRARVRDAVAHVLALKRKAKIRLR